MVSHIINYIFMSIFILVHCSVFLLYKLYLCLMSCSVEKQRNAIQVNEKISEVLILVYFRNYILDNHSFLLFS